MNDEREITGEEYDRARELNRLKVEAYSNAARMLESMIPAARKAGEEAARRQEEAFWKAFLGDDYPTVVESSP